MDKRNNITMLPSSTSDQALTQGNRRCFRGFPPGALDGCHATLQFGGGSLGFGDDRPDVMIGFGGHVGLISAELALLHLDRFIEPGRMRLVVMAESHYGVVLERPATTMEVDATEPLYDVIGSCGLRLLSAVTLDVAHQTRDERQAEPDAYPAWQGELSFRLLRGAYLDKRAPTK